MICETCGGETDTVECPGCGIAVRKLGRYCYICGGALDQGTVGGEVRGEREEDPLDLENRVLCSDGACIGVIGENGLCRVCGKPYVPES